eukprot:3367915-Rhodomonas_salina.1
MRPARRGPHQIADVAVRELGRGAWLLAVLVDELAVLVEVLVDERAERCQHHRDADNDASNSAVAQVVVVVVRGGRRLLVFVV